MSFDVIDQYNSFVENNFIKPNKTQLEVLKKLNLVWKSSQKKNLFLNNKKQEGVYLFGKVGTGKTFLLNLLYQNSKIGKKIHFNNLMIEIHNAIKNSSNKDNAIETYVKELGNKFKLLFIDEMHIFNIVDALMIKKIFFFLSKYKIFLIISSNFHPDDLYKDGLQRADFIPFIELIKNNYSVINIDINTDYRRQTLNQSKTYFTPITEETKKEFNRLFNRFVDETHLTTIKIKTNSREISFDRCSSNILMTEFKKICQGNLSHQDYINIAKYFNLIFLNNVPELNEQNKDSCRRFISLIDMLYENNCSVVILAAKPISNLNTNKSLDDEFKRTASRLYEMTIVQPTNEKIS
ncbi:cell division protein ZapE [Pelagibacteraceae bacterium]|nr:cell division protein ZapE [Pelagibacteraceae bacterium]